MFKKGVYMVLIVMLFFFLGGCAEEGEPEEELEEENQEELAEEESTEENEEEEQDAERKPVEDDDKDKQDEDEEKEPQNSEQDPAPDHKEEKSSTADYYLEDMESAWDSQIDFQAYDLKDWLLTDDEIHFLYEKEASLFYQSFDLNSGEELTKKKVEGAPTPADYEIMRDISFALHEFNNRVYGIIGQNDRITEERWDQLPEELQQEQRMMVIDLESDQILLSKTPTIEEYTIPEVAENFSGTYFPGFIFDVTADGRYVMILHSFPGMSGWDNFINHSMNHEKEDLKEENKEVLSQMEGTPLWVYDMKEDELIEIPYGDEIDALVPHNVEGLENGVNMIFTEQEGWLTLDIEAKQIQKTGEGGTYRRTEPGAPGVEQFWSGTLFGDDLFFTDVSEIAEMCGIPIFHYLWNFEDEQLEHLGIIGPNSNTQTFYFNDSTGEIVVNSANEIIEDGSETDGDDREYVERIYRFTFDEAQVLANHGDEPVESLKELDGFQVVNMMEFPINTYPDGEPRLSTYGNAYNALPIKDFHHRGYGVLAGRTIEQGAPFTEPLFYAYRNDEEEEKIVEIDGADRVITTDSQLIVLLDNQIQAFNLEEFFDKLEES